MRAEKINDNNKDLVIDLLQNVNGLRLVNYIVNNCHLLLNETDDINGTISYEKYNKYALIRYFVFKKNIDYEDLLVLYEHLNEELKNKCFSECIAIINSEEVKMVFEYLGFDKVDNSKVFLEETNFNNTVYKDNEVYVKKIS